MILAAVSGMDVAATIAVLSATVCFIAMAIVIARAEI